jgi:5-methylcytosine-specific restriction endonuclease McrA
MEISLAEFIRQRAQHCCVYCRMPQIYDELPFEVDHVVAEQHGGKTVASNLALACFADNHHKGPNLAGIDPKTRKRTWLFNPRRHRWWFKDTTAESLTAAEAGCLLESAG